MAKTKEELSQLKKEYETLNSKLKELSDDELRIVTGGQSFVPEIEAPIAPPELGPVFSED